MARHTLRYARYALSAVSAVSAVAFGLQLCN